MWWHLAVGDAILRHQSVRFADPLSFTHTAVWVNAQWLSESLFAALCRLVGLTGLELLALVVKVTAFLFVFAAMEAPPLDTRLGDLSVRLRRTARYGWCPPATVQFPPSRPPRLLAASATLAPTGKGLSRYLSFGALSFRSLGKPPLLLPSRLHLALLDSYCRLVERGDGMATCFGSPMAKTNGFAPCPLRPRHDRYALRVAQCQAGSGQHCPEQ